MNGEAAAMAGFGVGQQRPLNPSLQKNGLFEESIKTIYKDGVRVGGYMSNGGLKTYRLVEVDYTNVDELHNQTNV